MRPRHAISDEDWARIRDLLPGRPGQHGKVAKDNRLFIDAVRWIAKTGAPWRDLPERFGNWNSVWRRFDRWSKKGVWRRIFDALQDQDLEWVLLDSTVVRAHQDAAGAPKNGTAVVGKLLKPWDGAGAGFRPRSTSPPTRWATRSSSC
jgi:transposase